MLQTKFCEVFRSSKPIIGMIHLTGDDPVSRALDELRVFEEEGLDGVIVENYHNKDPRVLEQALQVVSRQAVRVAVGVNVSPNDYHRSITLATQTHASFVKLDHVGGRYEQGSLDYNLSEYETIRARYPRIPVLGGVHPKDYIPFLGSSLGSDLHQGARRADAIVVSGYRTGMETPLARIAEFRRILGEYPLIIGAGLNPTNAYAQLQIADGAIVGTWLKVGDDTRNDLDRYKIRDLMVEVYRVRSSAKTL